MPWTWNDVLESAPTFGGCDRTRTLFCAMTSVGPTSCASNNTGSDDLQIASSKQNEVRSPRNESASATWSYLRWIPSILVPPSFENRLSGPASPEDMPLALGDNVIQNPGTVKVQGKLVMWWTSSTSECLCSTNQDNQECLAFILPRSPVYDSQQAPESKDGQEKIKRMRS